LLLSLPIALADAMETKDKDVGIMACLKFWVDLYMLHPLLATDEVSGKSWQVITAINHECDDLTLYE
jgi:hypothetical protein